MVRGIDYGAYDWLQVGQLEALQDLSPQGLTPWSELG